MERPWRLGLLAACGLSLTGASCSLHAALGGSVHGRLRALLLLLGSLGVMAALAALLQVGRGARGWNPAAILRWWLDAVVLGAAAFVVLQGRYEARWGLGALAAVSLASAATVWFLVALGTPRYPLLRALDLVLFNLSVVLLAGEAGLRLLGRVRPTVLLAQDLARPVDKIRQSRLKPGAWHLGFPANATGHYDVDFTPRKPGTRLVLAIGDSFSVGVVPHYYHFTTVAERQLPSTEIHNMGISATALPEYLHLLLTEGLALDPDAVVANVFVGNDLNYLPVDPGGKGLLARFLDRQNCLLWQAPRRLAILVSEERHRASHQATRVPIGRLILAPEELELEFPWLLDPEREPPMFSRERYLEIEIERARALSIQPESGYHLRFEKLDAMRRACGHRSFLVMILPDVYQVEDALWDEVLPRSGAALDRDRPRALLVSWLQARGIPYLDLLPVLRAVEPMADGWRHVYRRQDTHFNRRGNDVVGRALAETLRRASD